jgi:hypothetical protein
MNRTGISPPMHSDQLSCRQPVMLRRPTPTERDRQNPAQREPQLTLGLGFER